MTIWEGIVRPQKTEEEIRLKRISDVTNWLPALKYSELYFRAGTYFFAYKRGDDGIVIGTCSKQKVFGKVVSDVNRKKLCRNFHRRYRKLTRLQETFDGKSSR